MQRRRVYYATVCLCNVLLRCFFLSCLSLGWGIRVDGERPVVRVCPSFCSSTQAVGTMTNEAVVERWALMLCELDATTARKRGRLHETDCHMVGKKQMDEPDDVV